MKSLVIYDSNFGNTKLVAEAIAAQLGPQSRALNVSDVNDADITMAELLVVGSPINGWKPTQKIIAFLSGLPDKILQNRKACAFDTRMDVFCSGNAANKISKMLHSKGCMIVEKPGTFFVKEKEGPLREGELVKARAWAEALVSRAQLL